MLKSVFRVELISCAETDFMLMGRPQGKKKTNFLISIITNYCLWSYCCLYKMLLLMGATQMSERVLWNHYTLSSLMIHKNFVPTAVEHLPIDSDQFVLILDFQDPFLRRGQYFMSFHGSWDVPLHFVFPQEVGPVAIGIARPRVWSSFLCIYSWLFFPFFPLKEYIFWKTS